ncbi:MAG TPA: transposase [Tepidisphaeraceae bacterium]|nr:transposase [Tepidisphaeraceae bacterium]
MAMGRRKTERQQALFIAAADLPRTAAHPFYAKLNEVLAGWKFDPFVEELCARFYAEKLGRPSLAPGKYFRLLLIGYFEGIDSERGIAWRCADSLSLRSFVGYEINEPSADHSTISRTRRLIDIETHQAVFQWVLKVLADYDLISGKTVGIDATTLEANAAMRSIVRKDTKQSYQEFLTDLAKASGIATPTREDLARTDKDRKNKASNNDWENPNDPDAKITKMKDGTTHLAHKQEHAVDMDSGAVLAVTIQPADEGDTTTWRQTVEETWQNLNAVQDDERVADRIHPNPVEEAVADKGYHSNQTMTDLKELEIRSYVSEPDHGMRNWEDKPAERDAVYANRRRIRGNRGKELSAKRGELIERSFAHTLETGGMRRVYLRGRINILKRMLIHVGGFDLGLVMRKLIGKGTPRGLQGAFWCLFAPVFVLWMIVLNVWRSLEESGRKNRTFRLAAQAA